MNAPDAALPPVRRVRWRPCVRIVPSRFPPLDLFARVADPADIDAVVAIESLTNERLRAAGAMRGLAPRDRLSGPGSSYILAPFAHVPPEGGRFSDALHGAWYAAKTRETAVRETVHHRERFMAATAEPPMDLEMRMLEADIDGTLHDLRGARELQPALYDPDDYTQSQAFARSLREAGSNGVVYDSVRHSSGHCVAVFRPRLLRNARPSDYLIYRWDGARISDVSRVTHRFLNG